MRSSYWLTAMLSALAALGLITCRTTLANVQEQDDKKPAVIILKLQTSEVLGKEDTEKVDEKDDDQDEDEDEDEKAMKDDDDQDDDDKESKSKKKKAEEKKAKTKKPKEKKTAKKPKSKPDQPAEERRPEPQRDQPRPREEMREDRPDPDQRRPDEQRPQKPRRGRPEQNRPNSDRPNSDQRGPDRPERGFQFRWEGEGPRPPQREEGRGGPPPEEVRRQMEQQREQMLRQREEIERHANEMREQAERMRREMEERTRQIEQSRDQVRQTEQRSHELVERLKSAEMQLEQRNQEVRKLKVALEERERAIVELKQALAKQGEKQSDVVKPKLSEKVADQRPVDPALIGRVEKLEAEIRKLMEVIRQQAQPKVRPKKAEVQVEKEIEGVEKAIELWNRQTQPKVKVDELKKETSKTEATVPDGGVIIFGGGQRREIRRAPMAPSRPNAPTFNSKIQSLTRGIRPETSSANPLVEANDVPPPTPLPDPDPIAPAGVKPVGAIDAASVGGVGIVEGDVVALLPQEGKFVLKVSTWHDGKQVRADWAGQQVSINQGNLPTVKPGDHVSLDARIEGQKGLVWGGKVFETK